MDDWADDSAAGTVGTSGHSNALIHEQHSHCYCKRSKEQQQQQCASWNAIFNPILFLLVLKRKRLISDLTVLTDEKNDGGGRQQNTVSWPMMGRLGTAPFLFVGQSLPECGP
mmetsp:Transcript_38675/g.70910  ORF Transcript_38675/g.70910 Transcript_38675/m.70910 type:complete len:112 (-) Transcript_38675:195-530(-)